MKKLYLLLALFVLILPTTLSAEFPEKPIKIVVYTQPGGMIDITARKIANILQEKKIASPVVVENRKGAGGIVALAHVLRQPADGYTILGLTSSLVSKVTSARKDSQLSNLHYLGRMAEDYECLITHKQSGLNSADDIVKAAKAKPSGQVWVGPAAGGTDHLFAQKFWKESGVKARWIPYRSGGEAIAALLGRHGDVYVGNPQDVAGREDLQVVAVASKERLPSFPNAQTFEEANLTALTNESLWRGFAVRNNTPQDVITKLEDILRRVSQDNDWKAFLESGDVKPVFDTHETFSKVVAAQISNDKALLNLS